MNDLSDDLRRAATGLRLAAPSAGLLRSRAERHRCTRRFLGGVTVLAAAVAVMVGSSVLSGWRAEEPLPATVPAPPSDSPSTDVEVPSIVGTTTVSMPFIGNYHLLVGRDRNVVVVIETTGYADRIERTMEFAVEQAIPSEAGRCGTNVLPCPAADVSTGIPEPGLFDISDDALMSTSDWKEITGQSVLPAKTAPTPLIGCLSIARPLDATAFRSGAYVESTGTAPDVNQFVMEFDSSTAAILAFAQIRAQFLDCPEPSGTAAPTTHIDVTNMVPAELATYTPLDDMFAAGISAG